MKHKFSKKALSLVLSLVMVLTMLPLSGIVAFGITDWTLISSTDFTGVTWTDNTGSGNYRFQHGTGFTSIDGGTTNYSEWDGCEYKSDNWTTFQTNSTDGVKIRDGFLRYSKNVEGGSDVSSTKATPVTGLSAFKVDVQFSFFNDCNLTSLQNDKDAFCFIKFKTDDYTSESRMWSNHWFTQAGYGSIYGYGSSDDVIARSPSATANDGTNYFHLGTSNDKISANQTLHYIAEFSHGELHSYVTDASGNLLINYGIVENAPSSTSNIKGIFIGAASGSNGDVYYQNLAVNNVRFYSGDPATDSSEKDLDQDKDKYLFAYFTGNSDDGERLRYAVSDDGYNFESLNGGWAVSKDIQATLAADAHAYPIYPTGTVEGTDARGNIRDPYILEAEDGSYYILGTDLDTDTNGFSDNAKLIVWHINDLRDIDSTDPWFIDITGMMNENIYKWNSTINRAWAPEAIWDPEMNAYMLHFAAANTSWNYGTRLYYVYTRDFKTFLTAPKPLLPHVSADTIDANITYYNGLYHLWYKDESVSKIGYATAEHPNGPYSQIEQFLPGSYSNVFEGPEVYKLHNSHDGGNYVMFADHFSSSDSFIAGYKNTTPFIHSGGYTELTPSTTFNISHLNPRHASMCRITTEQYNQLIAKFGKNSWDTSGLESGKDATDYLAARYFTTDDATFDASGNKHHLDTANPVMETVDGKFCANFYNGKYAEIDTYNDSTGEQMEGINASDGVTFDWWGRGLCDLDLNQNNGRFFDWTSSAAKTLVWNGEDQSQVNNSFIYCAQNLEFGTNTGYGSWYDRSVCDGFKRNELNEWHRYTMSVSNGWITFWRDGTLLQYGYTSDGGYSPKGTPFHGDQINQALFDRLRTLRFSYSSFSGDNEMWGQMSDFRIYNRALTYDDVHAADDVLSEYKVNDLNDSAIKFYDPMEDMDDETSYDGVEKHVYSASADDSTHGKVLDITGGVTTHNGTTENATYVDATSTDPDDGYTISFMYNPKTLESAGNPDAIFNIGDDGTPWGTRKYFEVLENGDAHFTWDISAAGDNYIDMTGLFGTGLTADEWHHITIQIIPYGKYDRIKTYINGTLVSTKNYADAANKVEGKSIRHYMAAATRNVYYGNSCGYWDDAGSGLLDEFKIYSGVITPASIIHEDDVKRSELIISEACNYYKAKMKELTSASYVYTNMKAAYDKYDEIQRYDDSVKYGGYEADVEEVLTLASQLRTLTDAMTDYTGPATKQGFSEADVNLGSGTSTLVNAAYTTNMLSTTNLNNQIVSENSNTKVYVRNTSSDQSPGERAAIYQSSFVWLYDGVNIPTAPINCGFTSNSKNGVTVRFSSLWVDSGDVSLGNNWKSRTNENSNYWIYDTGSNDFTNNKDNTSPSYNNGNCDDGEWLNASNVLSYNPSASVEEALDEGNDYLVTVNPTYGATFYDSWYSWGTKYVFYDHYINTSVPSIYVVNFVKVNNELTASARLNVLDDITDYSASTAKTLLAAYDALTSKSYMCDPGDGESVASKVNDLVTDITAKVATINTAVGAMTAKIDHSGVVAKVAADSAETNFYNAVLANDGIITNESTLAKDTTKKYTTSSHAAYTNAYEKIQDYFYHLNFHEGDQPYATDQATITRLSNNIDSAHVHLVRAADFSGINDLAEPASDETGVRIGNNYTAQNAQIYTYDSWMAFADDYDYAKEWYDKPAEFKADIPYYNVPFSKNANGPYIAYDDENNLVTQSNGKTPSYYVYLGEFYESEAAADPSQFETGTWVNTKTNSENPSSVAKVNVGDCRYSPGATEGGESALQTLIDGAVTDARATYAALAEVATSDHLNTFDTACTVADGTLDKGNYDSSSGTYLYDGKYTKAAIDLVEGKISDSDGAVYKTLEGTDLTKYNAATGKSFSSGAKVINLGNSDVDDETADVLTSVSQINDDDRKATYINQFWVKFKAQDEDGTTVVAETTTPKYYGESISLTVDSSALDGRKLNIWSNTIYSGTNATAIGSASAIGSQKASTNNSTTLNRIVNSNMYVLAELTNEDIADSMVRYNVYDAYKNLAEVHDLAGTPDLSVDGATITLVAGTTVTAKTIPLYNFNGWNVVQKSDNEYDLKPQYTPAASYSITATGAVESPGTKQYDQKVTITYDKATNGDKFVAWAENSSGKLKIASYNESYTFFVCAAEHYVPILNEGGTLKVLGDDTAILASEVDTTFSSTGNLTNDEFVNAMIFNSAPFITVQAQDITNTKARCYFRVSQGASGLSGFGVLFRKDGATGTESNMGISSTGIVKRAVTSKLESGQFTYTLNNNKPGGFGEGFNVPFRGFANYTFNYTVNGTTYENFNGTAYSGVANLTVPASA